jgi:hypothetical protein
MVIGYPNLFEESDEELQNKMSGCDTPEAALYKASFDILLLRRHERLIGKTEDLVRKTWWVSFATWALAGAAIITILIQLFSPR